MTIQNKAVSIQSSCISVEPSRHIPDMLEDVRNGLLEKPRTLPPKYFYDDHGSRLFNQICETEEYYPTRTEEDLLSRYSTDIIVKTRPDQIIELGSGTSRKTRKLLDACEFHDHQCEYAPFDVCEPIVCQVADELIDEYPWLDVQPLVGDYHAGLDNLPVEGGTRLFVFLGGTIGNFSPEETRVFLNDLRDCMSPGDYFLLGADRIKDVHILNAAYNDARGITANFNLNVLQVLNREMDANFKLYDFDHEAVFNRQLNQIEMYLVSRKDQTIHIGKLDKHLELMRDERILTEISRKFGRLELESLLQSIDLDIVDHYEPDNRYFSLVLSHLN